MTVTFDEFYKSFGLNGYPFNVYTSENEDDLIEKIFTRKSDYSILESLFNGKTSFVVTGNRGVGKTIILKDILLQPRNEDEIYLFLDNFEDVSSSNNQEDYYKLILKGLTDEILVYLGNNNNKLRAMDKNDKVLLSLLIKTFADNYTTENLKNNIETVQLGKYKMLANKFSKPLTGILNFFATAATNFGSELLTTTFGKYLPDVEINAVKKIFPEIKFRPNTEFSEVVVSYKFIDKVLFLANRVGIKRITVIVDRLDEDDDLENDIEEITEFIKSLFIGNKLLTNSKMQLIISVWALPFDSLKSKFRKQKNSVYEIEWSLAELESVLNKRLAVFSDDKINSYLDLFEPSIIPSFFNEIFELSNNNPRDLWHIMNHIIRSQYKINPEMNKLSNESITNGLKSFVTTFDFYEYYPKKKTAQKNSNDIYSYIEHLKKVQSLDFTRAEMESKASTGGSTQGYINNMLNLGLLEKQVEKRGRAVVYKIIDPKVSYLVLNSEYTHVNSIEAE